jgi:CheY-like chemotaxis protein
MLPITADRDRAPVARGRDALAARPARDAVRRWRVLVVDRNALVGAIVTRLLKGDEVVTARSEAAALAALALDADVDAILCALAAPEMSGFEFADMLSERHPRVRPRLVFMLGTASTPELLDRLELTGVPRLVKPLRLAPLVTQIDMVSDASRSPSPPARAARASGAGPGR